jgi:hypothetical protein
VAQGAFTPSANPQAAMRETQAGRRSGGPCTVKGGSGSIEGLLHDNH